MTALTYRPEITATGALMMTVERDGVIIGCLIGLKTKSGYRWRPNGGKRRGAPTVWHDTKELAAEELIAKKEGRIAP